MLRSDINILLSFVLQGPEMTWVVADHEATAGSSEITVRKGQQVEVLEVPSTQSPDLCLVRLSTSAGPSGGSATAGPSEQLEGLVPLAVLKPPPQRTRRNADNDGESNTSLLYSVKEDERLFFFQILIT